jgi:hypothetical protein
MGAIFPIAPPRRQQETAGDIQAKQPRFPSLADAIYHLVHRSADPAKALADRLGCRYADLLAWADVMQQRSLPSRLLVPLTLATGNTAVLRYLAEACGCVLVELPHDVTGTQADVMQAAARVTAEFGDVMTATGAALADGRITHEEAARAQNEARDVIAALHQFIAVLDEVAK